MYIWKINNLKAQLVAGGLSESESFKYLMANTVLYSLATIQYMNPNQYDLYTGFIGLIIAIVGLWIVYKFNGGSSGKNIIERYLAVGWVVFIRTVVLFMLPTLVCVIAYQEIFMGGVPEDTTLIDVYSIVLYEVVYIVLVTKHINQIATKDYALK